ncbi:MAG: hypothetical protein IKX21_04725 [Deltaproteobacteria bacterium]|nr:hypothetical protein [Deltaproteobacteria bacterium]
MLNRLYQPLTQKQRELTTALAELQAQYRITHGFFNCHYHKDAAGQYQSDAYPIPVISVMGLCDIEVDIDAVTFTSKLSKKQIVAFDWHNLDGTHFEVYGVEDYLHDYGTDQDVWQISRSVLNSEETEFFISFSFPICVDSEHALALIRLLQSNHFYY